MKKDIGVSYIYGNAKTLGNISQIPRNSHRKGGFECDSKTMIVESEAKLRGKQGKFGKRFEGFMEKEYTRNSLCCVYAYL